MVVRCDLNFVPRHSTSTVDTCVGNQHYFSDTGKCWLFIGCMCVNFWLLRKFTLNSLLLYFDWLYFFHPIHNIAEIVEKQEKINMNKQQERVDLGYVEECSSGLLTNKYFPSKVGGKPAWLDLQNIPKPSDLECAECKEPNVFLCQIYAPNEEKVECFHRTIYVFMCRNQNCNLSNSSR